MKKTLYLLLLFLFLSGSFTAQNTDRIEKLSVHLDSLSTEIPGLSGVVDLSINSAQLTTFLKAIASSNNLNISVDPTLKNIAVSQSFTKAKTKDVLLYLCKEYNLTIEVVGNILMVKKYKTPYIPKEIPVFYNSNNDLLTTDIRGDSLGVAFRKIMTVTGKNLLYSVGLSSKKISAYIKDMPFDAAIDKIALVNQLKVTKTKDNFYLFENSSQANAGRSRRRISASFNYKVKDTIQQLLEVNFTDAAIEDIIIDIAYDLQVNMATSKPLRNMGKTTIKSDSITFNNLLDKVLEDTKYSYKLENGMYFFGENQLLSIKNTEVVPLMNRSIELMMQPLQSSAGTFNNNGPIINSFSQDGRFDSTFGRNNNNQNRRNLSPQNRNSSTEQQMGNEAIQSIFPLGVLDSLDIKTDIEQNSFIVRGSAQRIQRFKEFVKKIDKPIPLVVIEVMIVEVNKSASVSAGIELGLGESPSTDSGTLFSNTNLTLGAQSINRDIGGLNVFGSLNIGRVVPNFYAKIEALETNGDLKIRSTPKLSALNGHTASLSNGQRTFFTQTLVNTIPGVNNPQIQQLENFIPIDANLSIKIRPLVSGDGTITLSIDVQQSSFNSGTRVSENAPPNIDTRQFNSTVRVKDQDVVILGGLEVNRKEDSGSGVPFLARIPIIKWLFSKRTRTASDAKLSVFIKPTIIK